MATTVEKVVTSIAWLALPDDSEFTFTNSGTYTIYVKVGATPTTVAGAHHLAPGESMNRIALGVHNVISSSDTAYCGYTTDDR